MTPNSLHVDLSLTWDRNNAPRRQTCPLPFPDMTMNSLDMSLTWDRNNAPRSQTCQLPFVLPGIETMYLAANMSSTILSYLGSKQC